MTEAERIQSIIHCGGRHLQNFKEKNITYTMCLVAVEKDGAAIDFVPQQYLTEEVYLTACLSEGDVLCKVPTEMISRKMCENAVSSDGLAISYVPVEFLDREMYLLAAKCTPLVMQKMPVEYLDAEFCLEVIRSYGDSAIHSIPKTHKNGGFYISIVEAIPRIIWKLPQAGRTAAVCKAAVTGMGYASCAEAIETEPTLLSQLHTSLYDHDVCLAFVKSSVFASAKDSRISGFNTESDRRRGLLYLNDRFEEKYSLKHILCWPDVCEIAVQCIPQCIRYVKSGVLTQEMCLEAVKRDSWSFVDVPERYKTKEICLLAFEKEPHSLKYFPKELLTYEMCLRGVKESAYLFNEIPREFQDYEMCIEAVKKVGTMIEHVPVEILDEKMILTAFQHLNGRGHGILRYIPEKLRTYRICLKAVEVDSASFDYVPQENKTYELCLTAAKGSWVWRFKGIPKEYFTEEFCLAMLQHSAVGFEDIPKERLTEKICLLAIGYGTRYEGTVLKSIPAEIVTQEMCDKAVAKSIHSFRDVPEKFVTKEMLFNIAEEAPGLLTLNFPEKYRKQEFFLEMMQFYPRAEWYVRKIMNKEMDNQ